MAYLPRLLCSFSSRRVALAICCIAGMTLWACATPDKIVLGPDLSGLSPNPDPDSDLVVSASDRSLFLGWREGLITMGNPAGPTSQRYGLYFRRAVESRRLVALQLRVNGRMIDLLRYLPPGTTAFPERAIGTLEFSEQAGLGVSIPLLASGDLKAVSDVGDKSSGASVNEDGCGVLSISVDEHGRLHAVDLVPAVDKICGP